MATRKEYQRKVENHIKDLAKRGIDPSIVTLGKSIETLGWSSKTYKSFMERKRIALRKEAKKQKIEKARTNSQGYTFSEDDFKRIKALQNKYNNKLNQEYKKYVKKYGKPDELTKAFLEGKPLRHKNSGENIMLPQSFASVNLLDRINENINIDEFIKLTEKKISTLRYENIIDDNSEYFDKAFLKPLVESMDMHDKERKILLDLYKRMNIVERYQFNKDMKRVMDIVPSDQKNPFSRNTPYYLIREFMEKEYKREFLEAY